MDSVNSAFHNLITDGTTPQVLLLCECTAMTSFTGNFYLSSDGDMTSDGAVFTDEMTSGDNYAVGCVPSRTMSVTLMNIEGHLSGHNFGWLQAYIGVRYSVSTYTPGSGENCRLTYGSDTYYGKSDGFYKNSTLEESGNCVGLYSMYDGYIYFFIELNGIVTANKYKVSDGNFAPHNGFSDAMIDKFSQGKSVMLNGNGYLHLKQDGVAESYYMACLGHFRVDRPKSTLGRTIAITDAFDLVHELDVDASPVIASSTATNMKEMLEELCTYCGLGIAYPTYEDPVAPLVGQLSSNIIKSRLQTIPVTQSLVSNNSYSCRRLVSYILEAAGCNARLQPKTKNLYIYMPDGEVEPVAYPLVANRIASNGIEIQERDTQAIDCVSVKPLNADPAMYPASGGDCVYEINGNPFVWYVGYSTLKYFERVPTYRPMTISVIEADPSFQCGDYIRLYLTYGNNEPLTTYGGENITTYTGDEISVVPLIGDWKLPLIAQTIKWNGKASAEYDIKGDPYRNEAFYSDDYIDTNARSTKRNIEYSSNETFAIYRNDDALHGIYLMPGPDKMQLVWGDNQILMDSAGVTIMGEDNTVQIPSDLYLGGHSSPVGSTVFNALSSNTSISAQTTTCTSLLSISLPKGVWMILGQVEFTAVVSRKVVTISPTSGAYQTNYGRNDSDTSTAQTTDVQCHCIVTPTTTTTYYLNANSSAACSAVATYTFLNAVRIA